MKNFFCKNISKVLMIIMLALCMLAMMSACQSKKELDLNNYEKYVNVKYYPLFDVENGNLIIVDSIDIYKVNKDDKLSDVKMKCSYEINGYAGEFSEYLGDLSSTYRKEIRIPGNTEHKSESMEITVLEISGTAQRSINSAGIALILVIGTFLVGFLILGLVFGRGKKVSNNFDTVQIGMTYEEVVEIVGEPGSISKADNITTCMWNIIILRGWTINCVITFKDDIVISKAG